MRKENFFILGAEDIEMKAIQDLLEEKRLPYAFAGINGIYRCNSTNAYAFESAIYISGAKVAIDNHTMYVLVECNPIDALKIPFRTTVDHHKKGDPGYGMNPSNYLQASSLGQVIKIIGLSEKDLSIEQLAVAAADHCLSAAYKGECPPLTLENILSVRLPELKNRYGLGKTQILDKIEEARHLFHVIKPTLIIGGQKVYDFRNMGVMPFLVEAGTIRGDSFLGYVDSRNPEKVLFSSPYPSLVESFLREAKRLCITDTYGDPIRGFAGGTQN